MPRQIVEDGRDAVVAILGVMPLPLEFRAIYNRQDLTEEVLPALDLLGDPKRA